MLRINKSEKNSDTEIEWWERERERMSVRWDMTYKAAMYLFAESETKHRNNFQKKSSLILSIGFYMVFSFGIDKKFYDVIKQCFATFLDALLLHSIVSLFLWHMKHTNCAFSLWIDNIFTLSLPSASSFFIRCYCWFCCCCCCYFGTAHTK